MEGTSERREIAVLIVDDSELWASTIDEILSGDREIRVVERVANGQLEIEAAERRRPDIILMDVRMPVLGGLEAIASIMACCPAPILVLTGDPRGRSGELTFEALRRGALDLMVKDTCYPPAEDFVRALRRKVKELAGIKVVRHVDPARLRWPATPEVSRRRPIRTVAIVASTGGPVALAAILKRLPPDFGAGVAVVQHMTMDFLPTFAAWLDGIGRLKVRMARDGDRLQPGRVLIAPDDRHLTVQPGDRIRLQEEPRGSAHRPSGDVLLDSVARSCGPAALGLVLSGMGRDGAAGLGALRRAGGRTLAQDERSSAVFGMPRAAAEAGAVERLVSPGEAAEILIALARDEDRHELPAGP